MKIKIQTILFVILLALSASEVILTVYAQKKLISYRSKKESDNNFTNNNNVLSFENLNEVIGLYQKELNQTNNKSKTTAISVNTLAVEPEKIKIKEPKQLKIVVQKIKNIEN
jgi:hypothetical protein